MTTTSTPYRGFRFPAEVIGHAVRLCHCFSLSLRDVELILAARGIVVSCKGIREWGLRLGRQFASTLKRRGPKPGDKWHVDEVLIRMGGKQHHLWRAIDQDGHGLDILVRSRRNTRAARRFLRKLLRGRQHVPRVIITKKLKSYAAAARTILPPVEHRQSKDRNNRIEVSLSAHARIRIHVQLRRYRLTAAQHRAARDAAFRTWREVVGVPAPAWAPDRPPTLHIESLANLTTPAIRGCHSSRHILWTI